jgi:hypothetical protein
MYYQKPHTLGPNTQKMLIKINMLDQHGKLTQLAKDLFNKEEDIRELDDEELKEFLKQLVQIFPSGVKSGGKYIRSAIGSSIVRKFKKFLQEYDYSRDIITKATESYVATKKKEGYKFMKVFTYFIDKQGEDSTLASYCEAIKNGETTEQGAARIERTL